MTAPPASRDAAALAGAGRWTVAIFALIGLGVGLVAFAFRTPTYEAEALVSVSNPVGPITDEISVVLGDTVSSAAESALGFEPDIHVTVSEIANVLTVTASQDDPQDAADAANATAFLYVQAQQGAAATVASDAVVPDSASGLGPLVYAALGTLAGSVLGAVVGYFQMARFARRRSAQRSDIAPPATPSPAPPPSLLPSPAPQRSVSAMDPTPQTPTGTQDSAPSSPFSDAATTGGAPEPSLLAPIEGLELGSNEWLGTEDTTAESPDPVTNSAPQAAPLYDVGKLTFATEPSATDINHLEDVDHLEELDRRALQSKFETARYELVLAQEQETARIRSEHERQSADLRTEIAELNKRVRMQAVRLKGRSGNDQTRVGDLEAQVDALEVELAGLRQTLESERILHTKQLTEERGAADRALDNARRQYRQELAKHVHTHRQSLAEHRADLDAELAEDRAQQAAALEEAHVEYERQLEGERERAEAKSTATTERHEREQADLVTAHQQEIERQAHQHKETISSLRGATETSDVQLNQLGKDNRQLRVEISSLQKQIRLADSDHASVVQTLSDELSIMRTELDGERERNAALRADVLRRSAEAHQTIDRAVEERTAQLAELESSVARQREYADTRVREVSAASEEQSRQAAIREANMAAEISRLKRDIAALSPAKPL